MIKEGNIFEVEEWIECVYIDRLGRPINKCICNFDGYGRQHK